TRTFWLRMSVTISARKSPFGPTRALLSLHRPSIVLPVLGRRPRWRRQCNLVPTPPTVSPLILGAGITITGQVWEAPSRTEPLTRRFLPLAMDFQRTSREHTGYSWIWSTTSGRLRLSH